MGRIPKSSHHQVKMNPVTPFSVFQETAVENEKFTKQSFQECSLTTKTSNCFEERDKQLIHIYRPVSHRNNDRKVFETRLHDHFYLYFKSLSQETMQHRIFRGRYLQRNSYGLVKHLRC